MPHLEFATLHDEKLSGSKTRVTLLDEDITGGDRSLIGLRYNLLLRELVKLRKE